MTLSERVNTAWAAMLEKYREELDSGVVASFSLTIKVNERQQIVEVIPALARRYKVEGVRVGS